MKPLILTDVDDVLLSWISGFRKYCSHVLGREIVGLPASWDMSEWLGVPKDGTASQMVDDFNHGKWEFGILPPVADANIFLPTLHKRGFEVIAITCCSVDPATVALRKANLYHVFGDIFTDVICQPLGTKKHENLKRFTTRNVVAWVEDKPSAALEGYDMGYPSYLIHQDHNKEHREKNKDDGLIHVESWMEISDHLWDAV